jgi:hypothetical protein
MNLFFPAGIPEETLLQIAKSVVSHHDKDEGNEQHALATAIFLDNLKYSGRLSFTHKNN